jgi:hypothetical protein
LPRLPDVAESQLTLPHDALVVLIDILYLIFKFALALWQSLDNDVRPIWNMMRNKQTLTNLEFGLSHTGTDAQQCTPAYKRITKPVVCPVVLLTKDEARKGYGSLRRYWEELSITCRWQGCFWCCLTLEP